MFIYTYDTLITWKLEQKMNIICMVQAELVYPNSLVPVIMCSDCGTCGLMNHCKYKMIEEVTRKCVRINCEAYRLKKHGLTRSDCIRKLNLASFPSATDCRYTRCEARYRESCTPISDDSQDDSERPRGTPY